MINIEDAVEAEMEWVSRWLAILAIVLTLAVVGGNLVRWWLH
jgi:hypothetical protein